MRASRLIATAFIALILLAHRASAQDSTKADASVSSELLRNLFNLEEKILALADVFPEAQYDWRPADGVRSVGEVFMHVAAINFAFPIVMGQEPPAYTGMKLENLATTAPAYEGSQTSREKIRPELEGAFENLRSAIDLTTASGLDRPMDVFGNTITPRGFWIEQLGHLHEHLGQLIAYSRMNGVVPPWSR